LWSGQQILGLIRCNQSMWCRALLVLMGEASCLEQCHLRYLSLRVMVCDVPNTDGLDDPQRSLPTPTILWFCDSMARGLGRTAEAAGFSTTTCGERQECQSLSAYSEYPSNKHSGNKLNSLHVFFLHSWWGDFKGILKWYEGRLALDQLTVRNWTSLPGVMVGSSTGYWIILPGTGLTIVSGLTKVLSQKWDRLPGITMP